MSPITPRPSSPGMTRLAKEPPNRFQSPLVSLFLRVRPMEYRIYVIETDANPRPSIAEKHHRRGSIVESYFLTTKSMWSSFCAPRAIIELFRDLWQKESGEVLAGAQ